jgi:uncharacterized protein
MNRTMTPLKTSVRVLVQAWLAMLLLFAGSLCAGETAIQQTDVYRRLKTEIDEIRLVDTHEHLPSEAERLKKPADCLAIMLHYVESDLVSAGLPRSGGDAWRIGLQDAKLPFDQRWAQFQEFWPDVRLTGYGRALERSARDLYGVRLDTLTPETGKELNARMAEVLKPGFYNWVLKEKARIDLSIEDVYTTKVDHDLFAAVLHFDSFADIHSPRDLASLAKQTGVQVASLEDLIKALEVAFEKGKRDGIVGIKSTLAYSRKISYPLPAEEEARAALAKLVEKRSVGREELLPLNNYMMHEVCKLAGRHHLPFQIHTGLQTAFGNRVITDTNPTHLVDLIKAHPETQFVIFHGSYPYGPELGTMAKNFSNVWIDMCWLHIISPKVARDYLSEWIETVPANKIMAFGGDYTYVEGAYAHAEMAREDVAWVLAEKVLSGYMTEADAVKLARKILRTNAVSLYGLPLK